MLAKAKERRHPPRRERTWGGMLLIQAGHAGRQGRRADRPAPGGGGQRFAACAPGAAHRVRERARLEVARLGTARILGKREASPDSGPRSADSQAQFRLGNELSSEALSRSQSVPRLKADEEEALLHFDGPGSRGTGGLRDGREAPRGRLARHAPDPVEAKRRWRRRSRWGPALGRQVQGEWLLSGKATSRTTGQAFLACARSREGNAECCYPGGRPDISQEGATGPRREEDSRGRFPFLP